MSTSIILLDQNFNANYVDIIVFEPSVLLNTRVDPLTTMLALLIRSYHGKMNTMARS